MGMQFCTLELVSFSLSSSNINIASEKYTIHFMLYVEPCQQGWVYDECASGCPPTCSNPSPGICLLVCEPGCRCEDGLVLDENTGDCVDPKNCTGMAQLIVYKLIFNGINVQ